MPDSSNTKISEDEIDFVKIVTLVKTWLFYPFRLWLSNKAITLVFIGLAVLTAFAVKLLVTPTYRSSFIIRPGDRTERFHLRQIGTLEKLRKQKNYAAIAKMLAIKEEDAATLRDITFIHPALNYTRDTINCTEIFIETTDYKLFHTFQNAVVQYLEGNAYFKKIRDLNTAQIEFQMKVVSSDLERLDSLKKLQLEGYRQMKLPSQQLLPLNDLINPVASYEATEKLVEKRNYLLAKSTFINSFFLVSPCAEFSSPYFPPRILIMCLISVPVFLLLCFVFLAIRNQRFEKN